VTDVVLQFYARVLLFFTASNQNHSRQQELWGSPDDNEEASVPWTRC